MDNRGQAADDSMMVYLAVIIMTGVLGSAAVSLAIERPVVAVGLVTLAGVLGGLWLSARAGRRVGDWVARQWGGADE